MNARFLMVLVVILSATALAWAADEPAPQPTVVHTIVLHHGPPLGQTPEQATEQGAAPATVFVQGNPIDVAYTIGNKGPGPFRCDEVSLDAARPDEYRLEVNNDKGEALADPRLLWGDGFPGGGPGGARSLSVGERFTKHAYLNQWVMPLAPGRYSVVGIYSPRQSGGSKAPPARSQQLGFEITATSQDDQRARIETLGRAVETATGNELHQSIRYLGFIGTTDALQRVVRGFYRNDAWAALWAWEAFVYLADRDAGRRLAVATMQTHGPEEHLKYLLEDYHVPASDTMAATIKALSDPDPERRVQAAAVLQRSSGAGEGPVDALLGALKDPVPRVRMAVAAALIVFRDPRIHLAVLQASYDPDPQVRGYLMDVLGTMKATEAIPRLQEVLLTETGLNAWAARTGLENIGTVEARDALRKGLALPDWSMRTHCAISLLAIGDESVRPVLIQAVKTAPEEKKNKLWQWLIHAAEMRGSDKAPKDYQTYSEDMTPWIKWLQQPPPTGPPLERR